MARGSMDFTKRERGDAAIWSEVATRRAWAYRANPLSPTKKKAGLTVVHPRQPGPILGRFSAYILAGSLAAAASVAVPASSEAAAEVSATGAAALSSTTGASSFLAPQAAIASEPAAMAVNRAIFFIESPLILIDARQRRAERLSAR